MTQYEFLDLAKDLFQSNSDDLLNYLENLLSLRDKSRRDGNQLLMPISLIDIGQHKSAKTDTKSYYKLPADYHMPVCIGKSTSKISMHNLNDEYVCMDVRTDDYRAKIKNVHEDNLFKNEDEIYQIDYKILKFDNLIYKLSLEYKNAKTWKQNREANGITQPQEYQTKFLKDCHFDFIFKWYTENITINLQ